MRGKRIISLICSICVIILLWFLVFHRTWEKLQIAGTVRRDPEGLTQMAEEILEKGNAEGYSYPGVRKITYWDGDTPGHTAWLDFFCYGFGIVPASSCKGFYYSPQDVPLGYQGSGQPLTEDGTGWSWEEEAGDHRYYTEKICDKFYFYEMHF